MATLSEDLFESKPRDAAGPASAHETPVIRSLMNRSDWLTLIALA